MVTAEELVEKVKQDPTYVLSLEEVRSTGKAGLRQVFELLLDLPQWRKELVDWLMEISEGYFRYFPEDSQHKEVKNAKL